MSSFLENVITPTEFINEEYTKILSELSVLLMTDDEVEFIGFVENPIKEADAKVDDIDVAIEVVNSKKQKVNISPV
jgi:hypothetical protein